MKTTIYKTTKADAIAAAREAREQGHTARVFKSERAYTVPGEGCTGYAVEFVVEVSN